MKIDISDIKKKYLEHHVFKISVIFASISILFVLIFISINIGTAKISLIDVLKSILYYMMPFADINIDDVTVNIVMSLRLPRIILAVIGGAGLAVSGVIMQGITRNPLVSPFTIGLSNAAAFGASLAIISGFTFAGTGRYFIIINAFVFSMGCALIVYSLSSVKRFKPETLVLSGIALTYLFNALTETLQLIASEEQLKAAISWEFGSFTGAQWNEIVIIGIILFIIFPFFLSYSLKLNAMASNSDENSKSLGINTSMVRIITGILAVFLTSSIISFTGVIGFAGIISPHIARLIVGSDHRYLLPFSFTLGSILLLVADTVGRMIISPAIVPVGIVVSYLGVPLFIYLIIIRKKEYYA